MLRLMGVILAGTLVVCLAGCSASTTSTSSSSSASSSTSTSITSDPAAAIANSSSDSAAAVDTYKTQIVNYLHSLQGVTTAANNALANADIAAANKAQDTVDSICTLVNAISAPEGYEESHQAFLGYAMNIKYAVGYMQAATVAKSSGDINLTAYYENLSADSLGKAADDASKATELLNANK